MITMSEFDNISLINKALGIPEDSTISCMLQTIEEIRVLANMGVELARTVMSDSSGKS